MSTGKELGKIGLGLGKSVLNGVTGGVAGMAIDAVSGLFGKSKKQQQEEANRQQIEQQKKLQGLQIEGAKELGAFNQQQNLDMWEKTNYSAQRAQMEKAGLSPALMMGGGGAGGSTAGGAAGSVGGASADGMAAQMGMGLQMEAQRAQIDLIRAQAEKTKVETEGAEEQKTQTIWENSIVRDKIGVDKWTKMKDAEVLRQTNTDVKQIREFEAWLDAAYDNAGLEDGVVDQFGTYYEGLNLPITRDQKAKLVEGVQRVYNLAKDLEVKNKDLEVKSKGMEKTDQDINLSKSSEELNKLNLEINDLAKHLSNWGLNSTTASMITSIFNTIFNKMVSQR